MNERTNGGNVISCYNYITRFLIFFDAMILRIKFLYFGKDWEKKRNVNNLSRYCTYAKELEKDNDSLSIARGLIGSERRSGPEKEEAEEWVETR